MLSSAQRAKLRSMASTMEPIVHVGKEGISPNLIKQVDDALEARELIKGTVLQNSEYTAKEALAELAEAVNAQAVQSIGRKFVLYRPSQKNPKIEL